MGRLIRAGVVSLDGYYEDDEGTINWSLPEPDLHQYANDMVGELDGIVMGRRLYEAMVPYWHEVLVNGDDDDISMDFARKWDRIPKYVASRTLTEVHETCTLLEGDAIEAILELKRSTDGDLEIGGGILSEQLDAIGEIDVYRPWLTPVAIGGGKPFFPAAKTEEFELTDMRRFPRGSVVLEYTVKR